MLLLRKIGNHQMVMTTPKVPTIKFAPISLIILQIVVYNVWSCVMCRTGYDYKKDGVG